MVLSGNQVSVDWLGQWLGASNLVLLDGSWHMPAANRDPSAEFTRQHIAGACFFDIEAVSDTDSDLPHMLPSPAQFDGALQTLGIGAEDTVVVYDSRGLFSAARVWWMFRAMGFERIAVLAGGLPAWVRANGAVHEGQSSQRPSPSTRFNPTVDHDWLVDYEQMKAGVLEGTLQVIDARSSARFEGSAPEPRPGIPSGHMPGAVNMPFDQLIDPENGCLLPTAALRSLFERCNIDLSKPVVSTCGSGITACVVALAVAELGGQPRVYDGSWLEWASRSAHDPSLVIRRC